MPRQYKYKYSQYRITDGAKFWNYAYDLVYQSIS
jgi:hypothetical protein